MIYLAIHLYNFTQLGKIEPERTEAIESYLRDHLSVRDNGGLRRFRESFVSQLGEGGAPDGAKIADRVSKTYTYLYEQREALFGFVLLLIDLEDDRPWSGVETQLQKHLLGIEEDDAIWMDERCRDLLQEYFDCEQVDRLWIVKAQSVSFRSFGEENPDFRLRSSALKYVLDGLASRLNRGSTEPGVLLVRGRESDTHGLVDELCAALYGDSEPVRPLHLHTVFRRQSPIHPFLNSIEASFLPQVPSFLRSGEKRLWSEDSGVLSYLKRQDLEGQCFDRLMPDFFSAYNLYVTAYLRMLEEKLLPALFFCEHFENYHVESLKWLSLLVSDFMGHGAFLPIFIGGSPDLPEPLRVLRLKPLRVFPMSRREVRHLAGTVFPGLELPSAVARRLSGLCGGNPIHALHCLFHLKDAGKVIREEKGHRWALLKEKAVKLPKNPAVCSLGLLRRLDPVTVDALYGVYIAAGLLEVEGLLEFLGDQGIPRDESEKALGCLRYLCLVKGDELPIPTLPSLKKRIESFMGSKTELMTKGLVEFVSRRYRSRRYSHLVLLFTFFARHGRHDLALEIYPHVLRQKLDERDFAGVQPFLEVDRTVFRDVLDRGQADRLELLLRTGKLRYTVNNDRGEALEEIKESLPEIKGRYRSSRERGHFLLQVSSWYLAKGQPQGAIEACKLALLDFNEQGEQHDEALAYGELGLAMLSAGRLEDAKEYLTLSERILAEPSFERLKTLGSMAIVTFIHGNLTSALRLVQNAAEVAGEIGRREWELFLLFFRGRIAFVLGDYGAAYEHFQRCLAFARVYEFFAACDVLYAWLGRSAAYLGESGLAEAVLGRTKHRRESSFFLAEARYLQGRNRDALRALRQAGGDGTGGDGTGGDGTGGDGTGGPPFPGERVFWDSGFAGIEGRCLAQEADESLLERLTSSFDAYLSALTGSEEQGAGALQRLTRANRLSTSDVYNSWYFYLSYLTLPESGEEDSVDRLTILNKALKLLQERANHIESPAQRYQYLTQNRWNALLMDEARKKRLL